MNTVTAADVVYFRVESYNLCYKYCNTVSEIILFKIKMKSKRYSTCVESMFDSVDCLTLG